jgi:hypothetical protein
MVLLGGVDQMEDHFYVFGDMLITMQDRSMVYAECTISLEIILYPPDGTPM